MKLQTVSANTICAWLLVGSVALVAADYANNQVEEEEEFGAAAFAPVNFGGRLSGQRRRFERRACKPCAPGEWQVLGMQRYAEPQCEQGGQVGAPCRMWQEPENKTLHFPSHVLECQDVYMQFPPCSAGLVCREAECSYLSARESGRAEAGAEYQLDGLGEEEELVSFGERFEPSSGRFPWAVGGFH